MCPCIELYKLDGVDDMNGSKDSNQSKLLIYTTEDGLAKIETTFDGDTVWLSIDQMAELFQRDKSTISRHVKNIFTEGELKREAVVANFATTAADCKTYQVDYYNLDVIISVGYRVKSTRGVQFRKWANSILKQYIIQGYAVNDNRMKQLGEVIRIMKRTENSLDAKQVLSVIEKYSLALELLDDYDHQTMKRPDGNKAVYILSYEECRQVIDSMKFSSDSDLFGNEKDDSFKGSIGNIYQSFAGQDIYPTLEEKAANLLYFVTKNHSFSDGNKRIAATMFLYFLDKNGILFADGNKLIDDHTLVALTIMIAESKPDEKEMMISVIMNCICG